MIDNTSHIWFFFYAVIATVTIVLFVRENLKRRRIDVDLKRDLLEEWHKKNKR